MVCMVYYDKTLGWHKINKLPERLIFDHPELIVEAFNQLREDLRNTSMAFHLLADKFTLTNLQRLYDRILDEKMTLETLERKS